jgi:putative transposase
VYRWFVPWAPQEIRTYFITTVTASRRRLFQVTANAELFVNTLNDQRSKRRMEVHAFVIMPDHVHLLLTPATDISLEKAMQYIKGGFSFRLKSKLDVWERSYDSRRILNAVDFVERAHYIHQNPVAAHVVSQAEAFPFSSASKPDLVDPMPQHFSQEIVGRG